MCGGDVFSLPELLVAVPDPESRPDETDQSLVLAQREGGAQQEALSVAQLGVELHVAVHVVVRPAPEKSRPRGGIKGMKLSCCHSLSDHAHDALGEARLPPETANGVAGVREHVGGLLDVFLWIMYYIIIIIIIS